MPKSTTEQTVVLFLANYKTKIAIYIDKITKICYGNNYHQPFCKPTLQNEGKIQHGRVPMNTVWKAVLVVLFMVVCVVSCEKGPSMLIGNFGRTPNDLVDPEYRTGNGYDHQLIWAVEAVLKENRNYGQDTYAFLLRGQRPASYSFKEYKASFPEDLVIEYGNGKKLAIFFNDLTHLEGKQWGISWDPKPPKLPQRIR